MALVAGPQSIPIQTLSGVASPQSVPIQTSGIDLFSIFHQWNVIQPLSVPFLHQWVVLQTAAVFTIDHNWEVKNILGSVIDHSWRVLPDKIITFFGEDIQCPVGKVDKT